MSNLAKHEKWTPEDIDDEVKDLANESDFLKVPVGRTVVRILPPRKGSRSPFVKAHQHYIDVPGLSNSANFNCPRRMGKRYCAACARYEELRATGSPTDFDLAGEIKPNKRVYANVIDRGNPDRGPVVFAFGKMIHEKLVALAHNPDWGDYTDPGPEGYDVCIIRTGEGKKTRYEVQGARNQTPLSADATTADEWLTVMKDLAQYGRVPSDMEVDRMLPGWGQMQQGAAPAMAPAAAPQEQLPEAAPAKRTRRNAADDAVDAEFVDA